MVSEGSEDEIDKNESQQEVSPRLMQKKIREKLRSYYDAGISAAEVITKDIPELIPRTIYNHYKLFNEKMTNSRKKGSGRKSIITKDIGLKIENLIKEDDLLNLEDIKKVLEKSNDKLILSKRTIKRYLKKKGYTHDMQLEKHELTQKQKKDRLKFWKEYINHDFSLTVFIDENLFRVRKAKQRKWRKNRRKVWNFL